MHIGIVVWSLFKHGGIEKFGINLAGEMIERGHKVTIIHTEKEPHENEPAYSVHPEATLVDIPRNRYIPQIIEKIREKILKSDIDVLAALFCWDDLLLFPNALYGTDIPLIISEHNAPSAIEASWNALERRACLSSADAIHILSPSFLTGCPSYLHERITVIPNPVTIKNDNLSGNERENSPRKTLLNVARFDENQKQLSILIKAFSLLEKKHPDWDLVLCGDGNSRPLYESLVSSLALEKRISMPGMINNVDTYYRKSHLFCIPSRFEGCPLTIPEAQNHSLAAVGFADCPGTNDIIVHKESGLLAEEMTAECLARNLDILMSSPEMRLRMGKRGKELLARYDSKMIYDKWEELFLSTEKNKGNTRLQEIFGSTPEEKNALENLEKFYIDVLFSRKDLVGRN